jgi:predicted ester cyclase
MGDGAFGTATQHPIVMLTIADCLCRDNQVVEEWLVRDQAGIAQQLGLDSIQHGKAMGLQNPENYTIGNEVFTKRWNAPDGLTIVGDEKLANRIIQTYDAIWNDKNLKVMDENYDRAIRFEGPSSELHYGRYPTGNFYNSLLAAIPDGSFEPHHVIVKEEAERAVRVALRWSYAGSHSGYGRYGEPTQAPLSILGISHFELREGKIVNEWMCIDETAIYAQIAAHITE